MTGFETEDGRPVPAVDAAQMAEIDRVATEEVGLGLLQMMENAGRALAATARDCLAGPDAPRGPVVVLAGNGGNGGGGLCAARHLANAGRAVRVVPDRDPADLTGAAASQRRVLRATEARVAADASLEGADLVVDALVGYGLDGPARGRAAELIRAANGAAAPVLSLDVPSGTDATTGERPGPAVAPDRTLTLALPKTGLAGLPGLWLADIGIPAGVFERAGVGDGRPFGGRDRVRLRSSGD